MPITTIEFCGRDAAESLSANSNTAIISVSDPDSDAPVLADGFHDVLRLRFFDVGPGVPGYAPMTVQDAGKIAHFIDRAHACNKILSLLAYCEARVSRSAAIALFAEALTGATLLRRRQTCLANRHVLAVLCSLRRLLHIDVPHAPALDSAFQLLFR